MIPKTHGAGASLWGLLAYVSHDAPSSDTPRPRTDARVADQGLIALPPGVTLRTGARTMIATVRERALLKQLAGVSARGRPTRDPYEHFSLSWHPDEGRPSRPEIEEAVEGALAAVGLEGHQAIWVGHADKGHFHVHIVVSRVRWQDGRTVKLSHERRKLSSWALAYERERGQIRCETRAAREAWRTRGRDLRAEQRAAEDCGDTLALGRLSQDLADHRRSFPAAEPVRGPGREARTDEERAAWTELYERQRAERDAVTRGRTGGGDREALATAQPPAGRDGSVPGTSRRRRRSQRRHRRRHRPSLEA